jgi:hypothetical protein
MACAPIPVTKRVRYLRFARLLIDSRHKKVKHQASQEDESGENRGRGLRAQNVPVGGNAAGARRNG